MSECNWQWEVTFYVGGKTFKEYVMAGNRRDALAAAKARNPHAKVIGDNPVCR